ncbi:MFS transporter [Limosilactobacillus sp.]|uniref:MFS transporter n=1 Tax=Limosilactobacillus sp. TaxID=2773925 RepID=UPI00345EF380
MSSKKQPHLILVTCALLMSNIMAGLDATIVNTAMPAITSDLHGLSYMGWIVATFLLGMSVSSSLWSKFGEHVGNKVAFVLATTLFLIGTIAQGLATNIQFFIIGRTIMGIGAGGVNIIPMIVYGFLYDDLKKRAQVIGLASAFFNTASIVGPLVGGWIVDFFGWRWIFFINVPIALISVVIVSMLFKPSHRMAAGKKIDIPGAVSMIIGLSLILTGIEMIGSIPNWETAILLIAGVVMMIVMFKLESHSDDAIIPTRFFTNHRLLVDFVFFMIMWGAFIAFLTYVPMWAQGILGLSAFIGGVTQIPGAITNFLGSELVAVINYRHIKYWLICGGIVSLAVAFLIVIIVGQSTPFWLLLVAGAFQGFGVGLNFNLLQMSVQTDVPLNDMPAATSVAYLLRILSQTMMSAVYGVVLNNTLAEHLRSHHGITMTMMNKLTNAATAKDLPQDLMPIMRHILYDAYHNIMYVGLGLTLVALILSIIVAIRKTRQYRETLNG